MVSIHAPARGATLFCHVFVLFNVSFNSRAREGRPAGLPLLADAPRVPSHAPARGATLSI